MPPRLPTFRIPPGFAERLLAVRHDIHRHPELAFEEVRTARLVAERLERLGLDSVTRGVGRTGVVGTLVGRGAGPAPRHEHVAPGRARPPVRSVGLRADMDALPMEEEGGVAYRSAEPGKAHMCGHDGHTAMLLGAAELLAQERERFSGVVHLIFQPAEEGKGGAAAMLGDGLFATHPCEEVYAIHNWPGLPVGVVDVQPGARMASADNFDVELRARGGHAAMPHLTSDPVVAAAAVVTALQTIASRWTHPVDPVVVSVTKIHGGSAHNVIPSRVHLAGTVRCFSNELRDALPGKMRSLVAAVAESYGVGAALAFEDAGFAATVNDAGAAERALRAAARTVGRDHVSTSCKASMGAEDFSEMLRHRRGAYVWLGAGVDVPGLHDPRFDFNDELLVVGSELYANMALEALGSE